MSVVQNLKRTEIVLGLVGAAGTDFRTVIDKLEAELKDIGYEIEYAKLSRLIEEYTAELKRNGTPISVNLDNFEDEGDRILKLMFAGNKLCERYKKEETIAILAIDTIQKRRSFRKPEEKNVAYILKSLKRPEEVHALRQVYGSGFFLIGVYSSYKNRKESLASEIAHSKGTISIEQCYPKAEELILKDQEDLDKYGQEVCNTFHLADVFISIEDQSKIENKIKRFVQLVFSYPFHTPTKAEHAMFFAQAAALRSGDLARQVGAVITTATGEILSVGTNDAPCFDGGLYWSDSENDQRDIKLGEDSNTAHINLIAQGLAQFLNITPVAEKEKIVKKIKDETYLKRLTEFGRSVHAEMDAITQAARLGVSIKGGTLYTTLFPCHNCTKHIVAVGIKKVIYIEPYAKSLAKILHKDSIAIEDEAQNKVSFLPFEGVGPRRFLDLFSIITSVGFEIQRKDKHSGKIKDWMAKYARPRLPLSTVSYLVEEKVRIEQIKQSE